MLLRRARRMQRAQKLRNTQESIFVVRIERETPTAIGERAGRPMKALAAAQQLHGQDQRRVIHQGLRLPPCFFTSLLSGPSHI